MALERDVAANIDWVMNVADPSAAERGSQHSERAAPSLPFWWSLLTCLTFALWGSTWDTPTQWRWIPLFAFATLLLLLVGLARRRRATPPPRRPGWRRGLLICLAAIAAVLASLGVGYTLAGLVPLPFTVSGLLLGIGTSLVVWRLPLTRPKRR